ncbi:MAG: hypothetical protein AAF267_11670 [Deinococcota bacterium]
MLENLRTSIKTLLILALASCLSMALAQSSNDITITWHQQNAPIAVEVAGFSEVTLQTLIAQELLTEQWQQVFQVIVVDEQLQNPVPMLGSYSIEADSLSFRPRFPLLAGQTYQASFSFAELVTLLPDLLDGSNLQQDTIISEFALPRADTPLAEVTAIYPSADELPENLLRFYVYFSAPMREGFAVEHIHLLDGQGHVLEGIFFDAIFELWDPSMQRLTLLFDPGRVKTGLRAHEELGRALTVGETYSLVINEDMRDASGQGLARAFEKTFTVTEADLSPPDVNLWQLITPEAGSTDALSIRFPAPLDHALLTDYVRVQNAEGEVVHGEILLEQNETVWHFNSETAWQTGSYSLLVNTKLEDIAGNNLHGLFDTPPEEKLILLGQTSVSISFQIRP